MLPDGLAANAPRGVRQRLEAFGGDLAGTVLAHAVAPMGESVARVLCVGAVLFEDAVDRVSGRAIDHDLREVGLSKSFAHTNSVWPPALRDSMLIDLMVMS